MNIAVKIDITKPGLINIADHLRNVPQDCKLFGYGRDRLYGLKEFTFESAVFGQLHASNGLKKKGVFISPACHSVSGLTSAYDGKKEYLLWKKRLMENHILAFQISFHFKENCQTPATSIQRILITFTIWFAY